MPSTALQGRIPSTAASVLLVLVVTVAAIATAATGAAALAADRTQQATTTGQTADSGANATVYVAPDSAWDDLDDVSAIARHVENGTLTRRTSTDEDPGVVTVNDTLVLAVTLPGFGERLSAAPGADTTARMRSLVERENASLSVVEQNPTTMRPAMLADLLAANATNETNATSATRVVAGDGDTAYLVVDVDEVVVEYSSPDNSREKLVEAPYHDRIFRVNATLDGTSATTLFNTLPPEATVPWTPGAETPLLPAAADTTLVGRANLAPGTAIDVTVVDESDRTLADETVTVDEGGRFATTVDTTGLANSTLEVRAAVGSTQLDPIEVGVRRERASLALSDQEGEGRRVVIDEVALSHGGVVVVRRNSSDGTVVGVTEVGVGNRSGLGVALEEPLTESGELVITAYRDVNANGAFDEGIDEAYGTSVTASYEVEADSELTATPTATTVRTGSGTPTDAAATEDAAPGLGVTTAIVALLSALSAARYRRHQ